MSPISQSKHPVNHNRFAILATLPSNHGLDTPIESKKRHSHQHHAQPEGFVHLRLPVDSFVIVHPKKPAKNNSWAMLDKPTASTPKKEGWFKRLLPSFLG